MTDYNPDDEQLDDQINDLEQWGHIFKPRGNKLPPKKDLTGRKVGKLTVFDFNGRDASGQEMWAVFCTCGKELSIPKNVLMAGTRKSCGRPACTKRNRKPKEVKE